MKKRKIATVLFVSSSLLLQSVVLPAAVGAQKPDAVASAGAELLSVEGKTEEILKIENRVLLGFADGYEVPQNAEIVIPAEVDRIADNAFLNQDKLTKITFDPESEVTEIGSKAFSGTSIASVAFPDTLKTIGDGAFLNAAKLSVVDFSQAAQLQQIGAQAFSGTAVVQILLPAKAKIGEEAFSNCSSLLTIRVPSDFSGTLGKDVFKNVSKDAKIYVLNAQDKTKFADKGITAENIILEEKSVVVSRNNQAVGSYASFEEAVAAVDALPPSVGEFEFLILKDVTIGQNGKLPGKSAVIEGAGGKLRLDTDLELREDLVIKKITIDDSAGKSIYAGGYELILANGVETSGKMSLYGGKKSGECASANLTVISGTYANITSGGTAGAEVKGNAVLSLSDFVKVTGKAYGGKDYTGNVSTVIFAGYGDLETLPVSCEGFDQLTLEGSNVALRDFPFDSLSLIGSDITFLENVEMNDLFADANSSIILAEGKKLSILGGAHPEQNHSIALTVDGTVLEEYVLITSAQESVTANLFMLTNLPQGMHLIKVGNDIKVLSAAPVDSSGVTVSATGITYGDMLAQSQLLQQGNFLYEGQEVKGTLCWKEPESKPEAGTQTAQWEFIPETSWLASVSGTVSVNVAKRNVTITPNAGQFKIFGQADPQEISYSAEGLLEGMVLEGALAREEGEFAGLYQILQGGLTNEANPNFEITFAQETVTFEIKKAELLLDTEIVPTAQKPGESVTVYVSASNPYQAGLTDGLPAGEQITLTAENAEPVAATLSPEGKYTFSYTIPADTPDGTDLALDIHAAESDNYTAAAEQISVLATTKHLVSLTSRALQDSFVYGTAPEISVTLTKMDDSVQEEPSGTICIYLGSNSQGEKLAEVPVADAGEIVLDQKRLDAGQHSIYVEYSGDEEFAPTYAKITLSIAKKDLTVKPEDITIKKGGQIPTVDGGIQILYDGFVEGEDETTPGVLTVEKEFRAELPKEIDVNTVGTYPITLVGEATADNYNIIKENGVLTIQKTSLPNSYVTRYLIRASCTAGGSISPKGLYQLVSGASLTYRITPDDGYEIEDVVVNGKSVGAVSSYTYRAYQNGTIVAKFRDKSLPKPQEHQFTDIEGHWAQDDIEYVVERGYFNGVSSTRFEPDSRITRAMVVAVIGRLDECETDGVSAFDDVPENAYYSPYVAWAEENGIVNGRGDNRFDPDASITRQEMAVIFSRYLNYCDAELEFNDADASPFRDKHNIADWAENDVDVMRRAGIIKGREDNRFDPEGTATRAEFAAILRRLLDNLGW